jgi:hypothetical protein
MKQLLLNPHLLKKGHIPVHNMKKGQFYGGSTSKATSHHRPTSHSAVASHKPTIKPLKFKF